MSIRTSFQIELNRLYESRDKYKRKWFEPAYNSWMQSTSYKGAVGKAKTGESLRADLGVDPTDNLQKMLMDAGLPDSSFKIDIYQKGDEKSLSGQFATAVITILKNISVGTTEFLKGEEYSIVSNIGKTVSGEKAPVSGGKLTPVALELEEGTYETIDSICATTIQNLKRKYAQTFPENYTEYLIKLVEYTRDQTSIPKYDNLSKFLKKAGKKFNLDFGKNLQQEYNIDERSLKKIANDFGEILGGIFLFSVVKDPGKGLSFPTDANAALVDFYFDGWSVSSKAGNKGGTPSIAAMARIIDGRVSNPGEEAAMELNKEEKITYDNILKLIANPKLNAGYLEPNTGRQSEVWLTHIVLANQILYKDESSGYKYILDALGIKPLQISRVGLMKKIDDLYKKDQNEWWQIMDMFWNKSKSRPRECTDKLKAIQYYKKRLKDKDRFGIMFYPLSKELVRTINDNKVYVNGLSSMINRVSTVQQLYLLVSGKSTGLEFKIKDFAAARFQFYAGASANNPFNKNIGLESR